MAQPGSARSDWNERARRAADCIPGGAKVLDVGCGSMALRSFLPAGCAYKPCDLVERDKNSIVCDFNAGQFPAYQGDPFDRPEGPPTQCLVINERATAARSILASFRMAVAMAPRSDLIVTLHLFVICAKQAEYSLPDSDFSTRLRVQRVSILGGQSS